MLVALILARLSEISSTSGSPPELRLIHAPADALWWYKILKLSPRDLNPWKQSEIRRTSSNSTQNHIHANFKIWYFSIHKYISNLISSSPNSSTNCLILTFSQAHALVLRILSSTLRKSIEHLWLKEGHTSSEAPAMMPSKIVVKFYVPRLFVTSVYSMLLLNALSMDT